MLTLRMRAKPVRSVEEHQAIIAAIAAGDPAQAGHHARDHRSRARDELIPLLARLKLRHL
jgi:DNA-binding GntR family transcriptional regulator